MAIQVENLSKKYGQQKALNSVTFQTGTRKIIGFLGPNGAGKSTCMKILTGILSADAGQVKILGIPVSQQNAMNKKNIGFLPENNPLYSEMYVLESLAFEAEIHGIKDRKNRIKEVIKLTGLAAEQHKKISELSKGFKQRVGLALAIIHDPKVIILDEPTTGLDPNQIIEIRTLIKKLGKEKTVLLSTHIMQEAEMICDEIIIIDKGELKAHFQITEMPILFPNKTMEEIFVSFTK